MAMVGDRVNAQDKNGRTALHFAAGGGGDDGAACVRVLLDVGCDWRLRDEHGISALGEAETSHNVEAAAMLRERLEANREAAAVTETEVISCYRNRNVKVTKSQSGVRSMRAMNERTNGVPSCWSTTQEGLAL